MVVDVATALMYGTQGHSSLFPMFGLDTMCTPWGRIVLTYCCILVLPAMEPLLGEWGASHCTIEDSRGCCLSCVSPPHSASTRVRVAICVE